MLSLDIYAVAVCFLAGCAIGFMWSATAVVRRTHFLRALEDVIDFLFWLLVTVVAFSALMVGTRGQVRFVPLASMLGGYLIYRALAASTVDRAMGWFCSGLGKIAETCTRPLVHVAGRLVGGLWRSARKLFSALVRKPSSADRRS